MAKTIERLSVERWVEIRPAVYGEEKWDLITAARGFVYPSRWEAFGNSAAEAAALGVPVLTGTYPLGLHLSDSDAGIAASPDPESLAEGLVRIGDPSSAKLGERAREVMRAFSWTDVGASWGRQLGDLVTTSR